MLYIDPDSCTDCGACASVCPTNAIFADGDVPSDQQPFIALNAEMALKCPSITQHRPR